MQFTIHINQSLAVEWGLNAQQALLFAFVYECPSWAKPVKTDSGIYFALSKAKIVEELPLLTDKPDTAYRLLRALNAAGLIELSSTSSITLVRLTEKGKAWNRKLDGSEKYPTSRTFNGRKKIRSTSEKSPTNQDTSNQDTNQQQPRDLAEVIEQQDRKAIEPQEDRQRFAMFAEWNPPADLVTTQLKLAGLNLEALTDETLQSFLGYYVAKSQVFDSNGGWCFRLAKWAKTEKAKGAAEQEEAGVDWAKKGVRV
ncbi:DnaT-like ssDNA-binding domain-containing protein [Pseudomonas sp. 1176_21]|uniref:DnaT-like ssDNA-binding domain-containing protein n=1 Tax=Pseudomonas sp. 1176_21 TaxID=2604453 RepID=UPI004064B0CA